MIRRMAKTKSSLPEQVSRQLWGQGKIMLQMLVSRRRHVVWNLALATNVTSKQQFLEDSVHWEEMIDHFSFTFTVRKIQRRLGMSSFVRGECDFGNDNDICVLFNMCDVDHPKIV